MNLHRKHEYFWQQSFMKLVAYPQGRAAELAGLGRVAFFDILKSYKVPVANLTREELKKEFESARKMRG